MNILVDLKPALDGYAGIPQETRLLFRGLRSIEDYAVEGLIQHGSRKLRPAVHIKSKKLKQAARVNRLSRAVISLYEKPYSSLIDNIRDHIERYFSLSILRLRAIAGLEVQPGVFETDLFDDFIWRTFFNKTLRPIDKGLVTQTRYRILRPSRVALHKVGLAGLKYGNNPSYLKINTTDYNVLLAQTPYPGRVSKGTQLVVRYHDAVPVLMPHTISDKAFHQATHFHALQNNIKQGAWFSCISEATRSDLLKIFPEAEPRTIVIHNMVSDEYFEENSHRNLVNQIIRNRIAGVDEFKTELSGIDFSDSKSAPAFEYLLMVSTLEPRKNHLLLMSAWERLKYTTMPKLKLVIVGSMGWDHQPILNAFKPWAQRGDLFYLNNVPSAELRVLYKHAAATICPSLAEGFDYSGVEAMRSGGIVISSDIPVHREIYGSASEYFDPYSTENAAEIIQNTLSPAGEDIRNRLRLAGKSVSERYTPKHILPKWQSFFSMIRQAQANR